MTVETTTFSFEILAQCLNDLIIIENKDEALAKIVTTIDVELKHTLTGIFKNNTTDKTVVSSLKYQASGNAVTLSSIQVSNIPEFVDVMKKGFLIALLEGDNSPHLSKLLRQNSLSSLLALPIYCQGDCWGFIVLGSQEPHYDWQQEKERLLLLATAIGANLESSSLQKNLYNRHEVYESTLATLNELIWEMDVRTKRTRIMGFAPRIGTFSQEEQDFDMDFIHNELVHPDDRERVKKNYEDLFLKEDKSSSEDSYRMLNADRTEYLWIQTRRTLLRDEYGNPAIIVGTTADITDTRKVEFELQQHKEQNEFLVQMLQESNEKLNKILNSSKEIILTIDLQNGMIENVNDAISILGYTPDEWVGQYYKRWTLDKRRRFHELIKHASESSTDIRSQHISFLNKAGTKSIPFEFSTSIFYFKNKKYLLCVLRDIHERLEYEKNLHKITQQLTHLINNIDDVYAIFNLKENRYEFVSENAEGFFGCSKEEFEKHGLFWKEIIHIEDHAGIIKQMEEVVEKKSKGEFFYRITTLTGESKMLLEKITIAVDAKGNADRAYIVKSDYTHIENAEQSLIESERKFRFISENITDFISIIDNDGKFIYASPSSQNVIGYNAAELTGEQSIYIIHPDDVRTFIEEALEKAVFEKLESQLRYRILSKKKDEYRWVETHYKPILDVNGETTSIICSTRDVTEREQLMKDLQQSLEKERELNELRSSFVSTASHQFRTPLTVIQTGVDIMEMYLEGMPDAKQKQFHKQFGRIHGEILRLQDLMNDVLLLGRADASRTPFNPELKDLIAFCKELIESKYGNNRYGADRKIIMSVTGKVQDVLFDPKLLDHALENIISNAYKYSTKGNIELKIAFEYAQVTISIIDKGIGIPEGDLTNLFQPFYRGGNTTEIEGTGLGLSIVKEFIDKHGGQIFVVSELNKGTTVNVILPLKH